MVKTEEVIKVYGFELSLDEDHSFLLMKLPRDRPFDEKESMELLRVIMKLCEENNPRGLLLDTKGNATKKPSREYRRWMREHGKSFNFEKNAILVESVRTQTLARIVLAMIGQSRNTKFFDNKEEAINWLRESK